MNYAEISAQSNIHNNLLDRFLALLYHAQAFKNYSLLRLFHLDFIEQELQEDNVIGTQYFQANSGIAQFFENLLSSRIFVSRSLRVRTFTIEFNE